MAILLPWRPSASQSARNRFVAPPLRPAGAYAGRARFRPVHEDRLPEVLRRAIGQVVEVGFAGIAPLDAPFAGQELYLEWCRDDVFGGFVIPEQDLEFLKEPSAACRRSLV